MFEDIQFENEQSRQTGITAYKDGRPIGILEYDLSADGRLRLDEISANPKYPGLGNELLRRFVQIAGPNRTIEGDISHNGTINWLARNGFFNGVAPGFDRTFSNPQTLSSFPFRRFLEQVGVELVSLTTSYNEQDFLNGHIDFPYQAGFVARTLSQVYINYQMH